MLPSLRLPTSSSSAGSQSEKDFRLILFKDSSPENWLTKQVSEDTLVTDDKFIPGELHCSAACYSENEGRRSMICYSFSGFYPESWQRTMASNKIYETEFSEQNGLICQKMSTADKCVKIFNSTQPSLPITVFLC